MMGDTVGGNDRFVRRFDNLLASPDIARKFETFIEISKLRVQKKNILPMLKRLLDQAIGGTDNTTTATHGAEHAFTEAVGKIVQQI